MADRAALGAAEAEAQTQAKAKAGAPPALDYEMIELLFFAYRDFVGDPDRMLARYGFGRAHHRVLHFVDRNPGLTIAELLDILRITKQSLNRVLKELIDEGYVAQRTGLADRRQRLLHTTARGQELARSLARTQAERIGRALAGAAPDARAAMRGFLAGMVDEEAREEVARRIALAGEGIMTTDLAPTDDAPHILVVDDDRRLRDLLARFLAGEGLRVSTAARASEAEAKLKSLVFDLMVLDVMMPGENGFDFARRLRLENDVPILMLTARAEAGDRVRGLEIGADDYLVKPFEPRELVLRINNILKRAAPAPAAPGAPEHVRFGPFLYRPEKGELRRGDEVMRITEREREILTILARRPGENVPREALIGPDSGANERTIDVQINRLRRKIETDAANPVHLQTVRGVGYRLAVDV